MATPPPDRAEPAAWLWRDDAGRHGVGLVGQSHLVPHLRDRSIHGPNVKFTDPRVVPRYQNLRRGHTSRVS